MTTATGTSSSERGDRELFAKGAGHRKAAILIAQRAARQQRVGHAGLGKPAGPELAAVAAAARPAVRPRVVAAVRQAVVEPELEAERG